MVKIDRLIIMINVEGLVWNLFLSLLYFKTRKSIPAKILWAVEENGKLLARLLSIGAILIVNVWKFSAEKGLAPTSKASRLQQRGRIMMVCPEPPQMTDENECFARRLNFVSCYAISKKKVSGLRTFPTISVYTYDLLSSNMCLKLKISKRSEFSFDWPP